MRTYFLSCFILFLINISLGFGQIVTDPLADVILNKSNSRYIVSARGSVFANPAFNLSSSGYFMPLQFATGKYYNSLIDKMKDEELFVQNYQAVFLFSSPVRSKIIDRKNRLSFYYRVNAGQQAYMTKDIFKLIVKGNASFAGKNVSLNPFSFSSAVYQEFAFNYYSVKDLSRERKFGFGIGFSALSGSDLNQITINKGSLFASEIGDSIFAQVDASCLQSEQESVGLFANKGFVLNVQFLYQFENKGTLYASIHDLGYMGWGSNTKHYHIDTSISFTGLDITSQNPFTNSEGVELDSLLEYNTNISKGSQWLFLFPEIHLAYHIDQLFKNANLNAGFVYKRAPYFLPRAYVNLNYQIGERFYIQPGLNLDHFGNLGLCFELGLDIENSLQFKLGTNHLEGLGLYGVNGQGVYTGLGLMF